MADIKFSEMSVESGASIDNGALLAIANVDNSSDTGYSSYATTVLDVATKINKHIQYATDLPTFTNQTVFGALNELKAGGGGSSTLAGLTDVTITTPTNNQVLKYNSSTNKWENGSGGGTTAGLGDLSDVTLTTPTNGQTLVYDSANSIWVNGNASGSSHTYSTTEQIVGVWTDGTTPVYEKVCTGTTDGDTAQVLVSGVDKVVSMTGHAGVYSLPAPYLDNNRRYIAVVVSNNDAKVYTMGSNYTGLSFEVVLRYTKSSS